MSAHSKSSGPSTTRRRSLPLPTTLESLRRLGKSVDDRVPGDTPQARHKRRSILRSLLAHLVARDARQGLEWTLMRVGNPEFVAMGLGRRTAVQLATEAVVLSGTSVEDALVRYGRLREGVLR